MCQPATTPLTTTGILENAETCSHCKKEPRGTGDCHTSGPPLRAGPVELGPAWDGEGKTKVLSGMYLKQERCPAP